MRFTVFLNGLKESANFALQNLINNPLRTLLSLLGVTIGIFCISAILSLVDSLNYNLKSSLSKLGKNVIYVDKWPWGDFSNYPWWKYINRPEIGIQEMKRLTNRYEEAGAIAFDASIGRKTLKAGERVAENIRTKAITKQYPAVRNIPIARGRYFSGAEFKKGSSVVILGHEVANNLFPQRGAIGHSIKALGRELQVVGVLEKAGESVIDFGGSVDNQAFIPVSLGEKLYTLSGEDARTSIMVKTAKGQSMSELQSDLTAVMRSIRNLEPKEANNFALNRVSMLTRQIDQVLQVANIAGWLVAAFSILVGGFGVANIMFVSVKERTPIIGIQKAIGAPNTFILVQVLVESIILCIIGGAIGILSVGLIALGINQLITFQLLLTTSNILTGLTLSTFIGVLAGIIPAYQASQMDPIGAIRYAM